MMSAKFKLNSIISQFIIALALISVSPVRATALPGINIKWRDEWDARKPKAITPLKDTPPFAVIHHSATKPCFTEDSCTSLVQSIQNYHMDTKKWDDIAYNFLIGEDGTIFEGRGWGIKGSHSKAYNPKSLGICMLGTFTNEDPNSKALNALKDLLSYSTMTNKLTSDYKLIGHRQVQATECPGTHFFKLLKTWEHYNPL